MFNIDIRDNHASPIKYDQMNRLKGVVTSSEVAEKIEEQRKENTGEPQSLEEQAISSVDEDIYEKLIKGCTYKWLRRDCNELPSS